MDEPTVDEYRRNVSLVIFWAIVEHIGIKWSADDSIVSIDFRT